MQVSRLGNPLINEVVIPIGQKDKFNRTSPADDLANFGTYALNPEPARLLNALFNLGVKETNRTDIVQALLTGIPVALKDLVLTRGQRATARCATPATTRRSSRAAGARCRRSEAGGSAAAGPPDCPNVAGRH